MVAVGGTGVFVAVAVGGTMVLVGVAVAGALCSSSKAPMSKAAPCGRAMPRWSVAGPLDAASTAGLPVTRAWVAVLPGALTYKFVSRMADNAVGSVPSLVATMSSTAGVKPSKTCAVLNPLWPKRLLSAELIVLVLTRQVGLLTLAALRQPTIKL